MIISLSEYRQDKKKEIIKQADIQRELGNFYQAISLYEEGLKNENEDYDSYLGLGISYEEIEEYDGALEAFSRGIICDDGRMEGYLERGKVYYQLRSLDLAILDFEMVLDLDEQNEEALYWITLATYEDNEVEECLFYVNQWIELEGYDAEMYGMKADCLLQLEEPYEAIKITNILIDQGEFLGESYFIKGLCYGLLNHHKGAEKFLKQGIRLGYENSRAYYVLAQIYEYRKDYVESKNLMKKALIKFPEFIEGYSFLGGLYGQIGMFEESIESYTTAIEKNPKDALSHMRRAIGQKSLGNLPAAIEDLTKAIELNPNLADGYMYRGVIHLLTKQYVNAIKDEKKAIELNEDNFLPYFYLGNIYLELRDIPRAIDYYSKSAAIHPMYYYTLINRGNCYRETKEFGLALEDINLGLELEETAFAFYHRARVYMDMRLFQEAELDLDQCMIRSMDQWGLLEKVAYGYSLIGQIEKAIAVYEKLKQWSKRIGKLDSRYDDRIQELRVQQEQKEEE